ncbi:MAG: AEC family transporter [Granulosicoccaceae bacterium]
MLHILLAIAPIFVLIVLGYALRRGNIPSLEFWNLNDRLVYWVLFPAMLFYKMSTTTFSSQLVGSYAVVVVGGLLSAVVFALLCARFSGYSASVNSSILQGATRHNAFVALAICEVLFGAEGLALASLITAILIPATNISVVSLMVVMLRQPSKGNIFLAILKDLARNPLILAVLLGVLCNSLNLKHIPVLHDVAFLLGGAALPVVLLCVGANIRVRAMVASTVPTVMAIVGKMIVFPLSILGLSLWVGLSEVQTMVALVFGCVPTAANSYTLARQMGGDAPLMAAIVTLQTGLSFISLPLCILLAQSYY